MEFLLSIKINDAMHFFFFVTHICKLMQRLDFVVFSFNFFCYLNIFFRLFFSFSLLLSFLFFFFFLSFNLTEKYFVKFRYCISVSNLYKCKQPKCISVFAYLNKAC